jgi:hypothetical protein
VAAPAPVAAGPGQGMNGATGVLAASDRDR